MSGKFLNSHHSIDDLRRGLQEIGPIEYKQNGCRPIKGSDFLPTAIRAAKKIGVTRLARISELEAISYPVMQSTRSNILDHSFCGINTGSNGKGPSATQSLISCIMETIESYSMEPRHPMLIRGSFHQLSKTHIVLDPAYCVRAFDCDPVKKREPFLWTESYCPDLDSTVLVPAESVYMTVRVTDYKTRTCFPRGYNGTGAGVTYLDATIHALYEIIERRHWCRVFSGRWNSYKIDPSSCLHLQSRIASFKGQPNQIEVFLIRSPDLPEIPVIQVKYRGANDTNYGWGCCLDFDIALERALSEAMQGQATVVSSSREDLFWDNHIKYAKNSFERPYRVFGFAPHRIEYGPEGLLQNLKLAVEHKTVSMDDARKLSGAKEFQTLQQEYQLIQDWLKRAGYGTFYVSNLARRGIDIPVVRVLVPNMASFPIFLRSIHMCQKGLYLLRYRNTSRRYLNFLSGKKSQYVMVIIKIYMFFKYALKVKFKILKNRIFSTSSYPPASAT